MYNRFSSLSFAVAVVALLLVAPLVGATIMDVRINQSVQWQGNITVGGFILNESDRGDGETAVNMSVALNGAQWTSNNSGANGTLWFNITAPSTLGAYNVSISDNGSGTGVHSRVFTVYITNLSNVSFTYGAVKPPFNNGSNFVVNVTAIHYNGSAAMGYNPLFEIFSANRERQSWTVTNTSALTDENGVKSYNVTVPSGASGSYALIIDRGVGVELFSIKSVLKLAASTESSSGEVLSVFAPSSPVRFLAKVRDSNGNPVTGATVSMALTLPNATQLNFTLSEYNSSASPGFYAYNYTLGSADGVYSTKIVAASAGATDVAFLAINSRAYSATLVPITAGSDFFHEWGGQRAITPGSDVAFNLLATNLSTKSLITGAVDYNLNNGTINCSNVSNITLTYLNGTVFNATVNATWQNSTNSGTPVCRVVFPSSSIAGTYIAQVNFSVNGTSLNASSTFTTQSYFLKVRSVSSFGGGDFMQVFSPGDNVTFSLGGYNLSSNAVINSTNITNIFVLNLRSLESTSGGQTLSVSSWTSTGSSPQVILALPASTTGMFVADFVANVSADNLTGQNVSGNAFILVKYIEGFISPQSSGGFGGSGGEGGESGPGGEPMAKCSGSETFAGFARDLKTNQNAQGVIINGVQEARDEITGQDVSGCLSVSQNISGSGSTGNNLQFNVTFASNSSCSFSGRYFALFNVTYKGNNDALPSGFRCSQLSFFPSIRVNKTTQQTGNMGGDFQMGINDSLNITVSNVRRTDGEAVAGSGSYASVSALETFNPSTGRTLITPIIPINLSFAYEDGDENAINLSLNTSAFGLSKWPSGFLMFTVRVENGSTSTTGEAGIQAVAFNAFNMMFGFPTVSVGDVYNATILVQSNVSTNTSFGGSGAGYASGATANRTSFSIKVGRPWEGQVSDVPLDDVAVANVSFFMVEDNWNKSGDFGFETWVINFTVPSTAPKGFSPAIITINNTQGDTVEVFMPLQLAKYTVAIPDEENLAIYQDTMAFIPGNVLETIGSFDAPVPEASQVITGINLTTLNVTYGVSPKMGFVCGKTQFNTTQYTMGGQNIKGYNSSVRILVIDNATAGVYDTLVINQTLGGTGKSGLISIHNTSNRTIIIQNATLGGAINFLLWDIRECPDVALINVSTTVSGGFSNNWAGQHVTNQDFTVPFKVLRGSAPVASATLGIKNIAEQNDMGGSRGGMGYKSILSAGSNYTVNSEATTNAFGIGFASLNISNSGQFNMFYNLTVGAESDAASFESGIFTEVKSYRVEAQSASAAIRTLTGKWNVAGVEECSGGADPAVWCLNASNYYNSSGNGNLTLLYANASNLNQTLYIGVFDEATDGELVNDSYTNKWYFTYDSLGFNIQLANDSNFSKSTIDSSGIRRYTGTVNSSFSAGNGSSIEIATGYLNQSNSTIGDGGTNGTLLIQFYQSPSGFEGSGNHRVSSATSNVTVKACAVTFGAQRSPIVGANVSFYLQQFTPMGQTTTNLAAYSPYNASATTGGIPAGPAGCIAAVISAPDGGWPSSFSGGAELRVRAVNGSSTEAGWAGMIERFA